MAYPAVDEARRAPMTNGQEEDCNDWEAPETPLAADQQGSLCVSICALLLAVPAIVGSWCWPILVGAIFAVSANLVSGNLVDFFHGIQVAVTFAMMTNITQFAWWTCSKNRKGMRHFQKFSPVYLLILSTVLVMVQPVLMLVFSSWPCADPYNTATPPLSPCVDNFIFDGSNTYLVPTTTSGWMVQIFCTYLGFIIMFAGVFQATSLHTKIAKRWRALRGQR